MYVCYVCVETHSKPTSFLFIQSHPQTFKLIDCLGLFIIIQWTKCYLAASPHATHLPWWVSLGTGAFNRPRHPHPHPPKKQTNLWTLIFSPVNKIHIFQCMVIYFAWILIPYCNFKKLGAHTPCYFIIHLSALSIICPSNHLTHFDDTFDM